MKKLIFITTSFVFFLIFLLPLIAAFLIKMVPENDQPPFDINIKRGIYQEFSVVQSFTPKEDGLTAIGMSLGNPNLMNKKETILDLMDQNGNVVRKVIINGANVQDGDFIKLVFEPIAHSKDINYTFKLSSPSAGPGEILTVPFSTTKTPRIGSAHYGSEEIEEGLPIVIFYKPASQFSVVRQILTSWLSKI